MKQEMININANLVAEPTFSSFEKEGEEVEVVNFTLVKNMERARSTSIVHLRRKAEKAEDFEKAI